MSSIMITGNNFLTGVTGVVNIGSAVPSVLVANNIGYRDDTASGYITENSGVASIPMDGASGWVNWGHGLSGTPTNIIITPLESGTATRTAWINQITSTVFQIGVTSSAASSPIAVYAGQSIDGGVVVDETVATNNGAANDMTLLPATPTTNDAYDFVYNSAALGAQSFGGITINIGTSGVGVWTVTWEYLASDGTWKALAGVVDGTVGFTAATGNQTVTWTIPQDWVSATAYGKTGCHVRARVSAYTSIVTQPLGTQAWLLDAMHWMWRAAIGNGN
jgi:hypothetical protein